MATVDDVVQQVARAAVAGHVAELIEDEQVGPEVPPQPSLEGRHGLLLEQVGQRSGERGQAHGVTLLERGLAEVLGQHRLAHAALAPKRTFSPRSMKSRPCSSS